MHDGIITLGQSLPETVLPAYFPADRSEGQITLPQSGKWTVLVYYPADFTFVCPTELADYARYHEKLAGLGVALIGISTDTVFTHKAWLDAEKMLAEVKFPLAADHAGRLARRLGIYNEEDGTALRGTFVIDPEGVLRAQEITWYDVGRSAAELVRQIEAFQFVAANPGVACPAGWKPGRKVLRPGLELVGRVGEELAA